MTPAETIHAAIKRLEQLKAESTRGPWENMSDDWRQNWIMGRAATPTEGYYGTEDVLCINDDNLDGTYMSDGDIDLICTLHATIDAQIALFRNFAEVYGEDKTPRGYVHAMTNLARKILGEQSRHDNANPVEQEPDGSWVYECADCGELWNGRRS